MTFLIVRNWKYLVLALFFLCLSPSLAKAQTIIRDSEIEYHLRQMSIPLLQAANLTPERVDLILVMDDNVNAFVAGGQNIFLYTGLFRELETVDELLAIIAHEAGHIAGGHLVRLQNVSDRASTQAILGAILGAAIGVLSRDGAAATGVIGGSQELGRRTILSHSRTYESSADQAALSYLMTARYPLGGLYSFMEKLSAQEYLPDALQSEYVRTHPITRDRLTDIQHRISLMETRQQYQSTPYQPEHTPDFWPRYQENFARMQAKILAYSHPTRALTRYDDAKESFVGQYAHAIAFYRLGDIGEALRYLQMLRTREPDNPYIMELKAQILFEQGDLGAAIDFYQQALEASTHAMPLVHIARAHALIERGTEPSDLGDALRHLQSAAKSEGRSPRLHRLAAIAYGRLGENGWARYHLAERGILLGDTTYAREQIALARRAMNDDDDTKSQSDPSADMGVIAQAPLAQRLDDLENWLEQQ